MERFSTASERAGRRGTKHKLEFSTCYFLEVQFNRRWMPGCWDVTMSTLFLSVNGNIAVFHLYCICVVERHTHCDKLVHVEQGISTFS